MARDKIIQIIGLIDGQPSTFDGQYLVEYDPSRDGVQIGWMNVHLVTTPDPAEATRYEAVEALDLWNQVDQRQPLRVDGRPNKPLTAFTIMTTPAPEETP